MLLLTTAPTYVPHIWMQENSFVLFRMVQFLTSCLMAKVKQWPTQRYLFWSALALVAFLTLLLRVVHLGQSYDIHGDEWIYLHISENVADHHGLRFFDRPFFLHPPAFFFFEAAYLKLFQPSSSNIIEKIYAVRHVNAVFAALSAAALLSIGRAVAGWAGGLAAASMFALDPFVTRMNSLNLLDTSAVFWVLLGYSLVLPAVARPGVGEPQRRLTLQRGIAAGLAFGVALLTKDMTIFLSVLPLALCFVLRWSLRRQDVVLVVAVTTITYLQYLLAVVAVGQWQDFMASKSHGLLRFAGLVQVTGFNQTGGPSFLQAIVNNLSQYVTTYAFIGCGVVACSLLVVLGGARNRLVAAFTVSAYALLGYSILQGTLEEQFFYFLIVPSILATAVAITQVLVAHVIIGWKIGVRPHRAAVLVTVIAGIVFFSWSSAVWGRVHFTPDNGYERLLIYLDHNLPKQSDLTISSLTAYYLLGGRYQVNYLEPTQRLRAAETSGQYLQISTQQIENNYGAITPGDYVWLASHGERVFVFEGRSLGTLAVYRLPATNQPSKDFITDR